MALSDWARSVAERHLAAQNPRRWSHVVGVAVQARLLARVLGDDAELLIAAAWLHDVGYAQDLVDTGFHPLDGARFLRRLAAPERLASLVAHHTGALHEAELRDLAGPLLTEFPREVSAAADALWYVDLTTGPDGERVSVEERTAEIERRYGPQHVVTQFVREARPELLAAVRRAESLLATSD